MTESHPSWSSIFNFALLLGGLGYLLRKPIRKALTGRRDDIQKAVEESEALRRDVEAMVREYEGKLGRLDAEIAAILTEAKAEGEKEREKILARANQTAERILEDARTAGLRETERVKRKLRREIVERAIGKASDLLKGRVTEKDHHLFTEALMHRLEGGNGSGR